MLSAVLLLPKPTIFPPFVDVVLNQASTLNVCGPLTAVALVPGTVAAPLNVLAVSVSPVRAPGVPRWVSLATVTSLPDAQS